MWLYYYFDFERNYGALKSKSPSILRNKSSNFNKNNRIKIGKSRTQFLERHSAHMKTVKLKVKLMIGACKRKKHFLYHLCCLKEIFLAYLFSLNVKGIEYTFRILILFHIKKPYFVHFFPCF